jgi:hypothetical protein
MNQYFKPLILGLVIIGLMAFSGPSISASAQNQSAGGSMTGENVTAGGQNETLQVEGTSGLNQSVARNESVGGGGVEPGWLQ